jgi:hypothetical protein
MASTPHTMSHERPRTVGIGDEAASIGASAAEVLSPSPAKPSLPPHDQLPLVKQVIGAQTQPLEERAILHKVGRFPADTFREESRRRWWGRMVVAGGTKRLEILAAAGLRDCINCHRTTMHFVVGDGEQLHFVDTSGLGRAWQLICDICRHTSPLKDQEADGGAP